MDLNYLVDSIHIRNRQKVIEQKIQIKLENKIKNYTRKNIKRDKIKIGWGNIIIVCEVYTKIKEILMLFIIIIVNIFKTRL